MGRGYTFEGVQMGYTLGKGFACRLAPSVNSRTQSESQTVLSRSKEMSSRGPALNGYGPRMFRLRPCSLTYFGTRK